ncbi:MAG: hypothetical protein IJ334_01360 [Clostridia bacterium]|nr:hypothetical protein [Clostridia bacterium]
MYEYHAFQTSEEVERFREMFNGLHDAYVIGFTCSRPIRTNCYSTSSCWAADTVTIRVQVTSMPEIPVVELTFHNVRDHNLPCGFSDMFGFSFYFAPDKEKIIWTSEPAYEPGKFTPEEMRRFYYIEAARAGWQLIDLPGIRLNRGGSAEGYWYIMPEVGLPMGDWLERFADGVEILSESYGNEIYVVCDLIRGYDEWIDSLYPPENVSFTTDTLPSFRSEEASVREDGKPYEWYRINTREELRNALAYSSPTGFFIAIRDGEGLMFTLEHIEMNEFNLAIHDYRNQIHDERLYRPFHDILGNIDPYSGNGWEELS